MPDTARLHLPRFRWLLWLALIALASTPLLLYTRPGFLVMLSDMLWACF